MPEIAQRHIAFAHWQVMEQGAYGRLRSPTSRVTRHGWWCARNFCKMEDPAAPRQGRFVPPMITKCSGKKSTSIIELFVRYLTPSRQGNGGTDARLCVPKTPSLLIT